MIRSKGEAGTGDIVEAVRHLRRIRGEIRRADDARPRGAADRRQGARRAAAARAPGRRRGPAARSCCSAPAGSPPRPTPRWSCSSAPRACSSAPASSSPRIPSRRARAIVEATTHFRDPARVAAASTGLGQAMDEPRDLEARVRAAARPPRLVATGHRRRRVAAASACSRCRATSRPTPGCCARLGADAREVRVPADLEGLDALVLPGGESTTMTLGIEREGLAEPLRALAATGTPILGTCAGHDHARPRSPRDPRHPRASATRSAGRCARSRPTSRSPGSSGGPVHAVFIRAPWVAETGPRSRCSPRSTATRWRSARATIVAISFHPELSGEPRLHELVLSLVG